jgi:hypothetical protein
MYGIYANMTGVYWWWMLPYIAAYMDIHGSYGIVCEVVVKGQELVCFFYMLFVTALYGDWEKMILKLFWKSLPSGND